MNCFACFEVIFFIYVCFGRCSAHLAVMKSNMAFKLKFYFKTFMCTEYFPCISRIFQPLERNYYGQNGALNVFVVFFFLFLRHELPKLQKKKEKQMIQYKLLKTSTMNSFSLSFTHSKRHRAKIISCWMATLPSALFFPQVAEYGVSQTSSPPPPVNPNHIQFTS